MDESCMIGNYLKSQLQMDLSFNKCETCNKLFVNTFNLIKSRVYYGACMGAKCMSFNKFETCNKLFVNTFNLIKSRVYYGACMGAKCMSFNKCETCNKLFVNTFNLIKSRVYYGACMGATGFAIGACILPLLGFGLAGITAGSMAASRQGRAVVAGSRFSILQSLGATGLGILLFGFIGSGLGIFASLTVKLVWCECGKE